MAKKKQQHTETQEEARKLFDFFRSEEALKQLLVQVEPNRLSIKIGGEIGIAALEDCSMITASYNVDGKSDGKIIVIGSKRIDYGNVVSIINYMSNTLSELFSGINL